ncbi:penicillin-binding transpeptidase domain-containing protein [Granulicella arctica]|uniref:penicillin-binding transpeptidase domain-containing protein n=1 Tax=Granulicella arctica TaxID=940613 RepID=UPI0037BE7C65
MGTPLFASTHRAPVRAKSVHAAARPVGRTKATAAHGKVSRARGSKVVVTVRGARGRRGGRAVLAVRRTRYSERFSASSFAENADNLTLGDVTAGEDPTVRAAAIQALGNMNGTALAIDPSSGRILAMVNQKLALSSGAEPCSTIKLTVALAALEEGLIKRDTPVSLGGGYRVDLTYALAKSINPFFEVLGRTLGFERVKHYANEFGLGELAGYQIQGEQLGIYPDQELPQKMGGVGRMCSFGESISMTPLQLGAIVSAIANGGTLYYLQHPETQEQVASFNPKVKRILNIAPILPEIIPGMAGAVNNGTARSLKANFSEFPVMGKTGTCSNNGTRFGWFGSYAETPTGRIVTVIFLEGGRPTFGPKAAELTGQFYRALYDKSYFTPKVQTVALNGTR